MTKSSLSQQLREALTIVKDYRHKFHVRMENELAIINILPAFLTEHEALQRKADELAEALGKDVGHNDDCMFCGFKDKYISNILSNYREATKPSDV